MFKRKYSISNMCDRKANFIKKAKIIHKDENIDYSYVVYKNNRTPVKLIDHDLKEDGTEYGEFWQTPSNHLKGHSHPLKRNIKISSKKRLSQEEVIKRFQEVHKGENLDYSQVVYVNMHTPVKIISHDLKEDGTEYGVFWQEPCVHLKGCTHPELGRQKQIKKQTFTNEMFLQKAKIIHSKDNYNYDLVAYNGYRTPISIICNKTDAKGNIHGIFNITPDNFLQGKGCPKCGNHLSIAEDDIVAFIRETLGLTAIQREHKLLQGKEIDIYIPEKKIGFEYNGLRWHSEQFNKDKNYHLKKKEECQKIGVTLFHIFEDEYLYHKEVLFSKIRRILDCVNDCKRIAARKCIIKEINNTMASKFLQDNHIQGYVKSSVYLGGFYNEQLISVMSFKKEHDNVWNLTRFASDINCIVQGMCSKMLKYFISTQNVTTIKTFLDRRWEKNNDDNVYVKCGFIKDCVLKPDYHYTNGHGQRLHKFGFRKQILHNKYGFPLTMTEKEMVTQLGYYKIWDCGLVRYVYNVK